MCILAYVIIKSDLALNQTCKIKCVKILYNFDFYNIYVYFSRLELVRIFIIVFSWDSMGWIITNVVWFFGLELLPECKQKKRFEKERDVLGNWSVSLIECQKKKKSQRESKGSW